MRHTITTAAGFIESHLLCQLSAKGERVIASSLSGSSHHSESVRIKRKSLLPMLGPCTGVLNLAEAHQPETVSHVGPMLARRVTTVRRWHLGRRNGYVINSEGGEALRHSGSPYA
jgi:hypothetical protein